MNIAFIGMAAALGLSAAGSAFGAGFAGMASVGAWKKCYASGKAAPFIMIAFSGAPLTQTIYGFLLMNFIKSAVAGGADAGLALGVGLLADLQSDFPDYSRVNAQQLLQTLLAQPVKVPRTTSS